MLYIAQKLKDMTIADLLSELYDRLDVHEEFTVTGDYVDLKLEKGDFTIYLFGDIESECNKIFGDE